jgi:polyhydroxyalkanoate synthase
MINPPAANKYGYWISEKLPDTAEEWLKGATQKEGSWWTDWLAWLKPHLGAQVPAREPGKIGGKTKAKSLEPAPGSYARVRTDAR